MSIEEQIQSAKEHLQYLEKMKSRIGKANCFKDTIGGVEKFIIIRKCIMDSSAIENFELWIDSFSANRIEINSYVLNTSYFVDDVDVEQITIKEFKEGVKQVLSNFTSFYFAELEELYQ